ncbi:unnamed protein product [Amoebophrya sp. A120]|nr:unnamed protein product [Amoebophrya sp. A120]|eukprot:GSA120T00008033001.1
MASTTSPVIVRLNGYLVDVTGFIDRHPGGRQKIANLFRKAGPGKIPDASPDFNSHFGSTTNTMRKAVAEFESECKRAGGGSCGEENNKVPTEVRFSGNDTRSQPYSGSVFIVGKA